MKMNALRQFKFIPVMMGVLVLVGCETQVVENPEWKTESMAAFGIDYQMPYNAVLFSDDPQLNTVREDDEMLFTVAVLDAYQTKLNKPNPVELFDWNYFLAHQPKERQSYRQLDFDWKQYHSVKDTFTPNVIINDIPMYLESNYGTIFFNDNSYAGDQYYYRAHFFIQNGLNYVRVTVPVNIPSDYLETMDEAAIINLMNSHINDESVNAKYVLFTEVLSRITIQDKFLSADWEDETDLACQSLLDSNVESPKIKLVPGLHSVVRIQELNKEYDPNDPEQITILSMNDQNEYQEIFSNENLETDYQSFNLMLNSNGLIRKRENHENGYVRLDLFDLTGATLEGCYPSTIPTTQALQEVGTHKYLYTEPQRSRDGSAASQPVIYIADVKGNVVDTVITKQLPNWVISSSRIVGWSNDQKFIYVTRIGWEGYEMGDLWKIDIDNKTIEHITQAEEIALGALNVLPQKDLAVGIHYTETKCDDCMGSTTGGAPVSIRLFDLENNTVRTVYSSRTNLVSSPLLTPDGSQMYFVETLPSGDRVLYSMNIDGTELAEVAKNKYIQGMSENGGIIVLQDYGQENNYTYQVMNVEDKTIEEHQIAKIHEDEYVEFMGCSYPLGFSCLYPYE